MSKPLKDSGARVKSLTGADKEPSDGRGDFALLPWDVLWRDAQHYEAGGKKYAPRNWEKGIEFSRCFCSAVRHMTQWWLGDDSEDHLIAARWHLGALARYESAIKAGSLPEALDDRPLKRGENK